MSDATRLLEAATAGDRRAAADLLPLVYDELRRLASARMAAESPGHTLDATALVHEAYLRLLGDQQFDGRGHFFAAAAEAMRRILVESARRRATTKRGAIGSGFRSPKTWSPVAKTRTSSVFTRWSINWRPTTHGPRNSSNSTSSRGSRWNVRPRCSASPSGSRTGTGRSPEPGCSATWAGTENNPEHARQSPAGARA